jgi:hypothetical protein
MFGDGGYGGGGLFGSGSKYKRPSRKKLVAS